MSAAGQPLNDFELTSFLHAGLGSKYDPFVTSVTTRVDPLSIEDLYSHLFTHEMRLKHNTIAADSVFPSANLAAARPIFQRNKGPYCGQSSSNGSYRGATHHIAHSLHNQSHGSRGRSGHGKGPPTSSTNSTPRQFCQVSNKPSHTTLTCYHRFD